MSVRWTRDDRGLVIQQKGNLVARLFGVPFLAAAAILGWHFVAGLVGFVVPSQGQLTVAGLVMLPLCVLAFGTPGWILVFGRKRTEIDATRRSVVEVRDFLVHSFREESEVPKDAAVRAHLEGSQGSKRTIVLLLVEIVSRKQAPVQLAVFDGKEEAPSRELAMEAAGVLGVPFVDDIDKGPIGPSDEDQDDEVDEPAT